MYKINQQTKTLEKVEEKTFEDIKCKERQDLQEWIVSNPAILGEDLLIIQKEFSDFENTNERLDLLALDKNGRLVIIENKTDDTGKDVVWQAIKYASYCSTLTAVQVREIYNKYINKYGIDLNADESLLEFLNTDSLENTEINPANSQRIMLVSHKFRPEVLSAAQWLLNYKVDIACIKVMPLKYGEDLFLDADQILPQIETKEYTLKLAEKAIESQTQQKLLAKSEKLRNEFWKFFIPKFNTKSNLFSNISFDRKDHWLGTAARMLSGISYNFLICKDYCGVELTIANGNKELNKKVYDALFVRKYEIEEKLKEYKLEWERLDSACMSRICVRNKDLSLYRTEMWDDIGTYLTDVMIHFEKVFKDYAFLVKAQNK